jgi:GTP cyclohydrolase I
MEALVKKLLSELGEDPEREGLKATPRRVAQAWRFLTKGYETDPRDVLNDAIFHEKVDEMITVRDIEVYSMCEHHLLPFFGKAHVAYIPAGKIIGFSKIPRLVDIYARRLQVQERLTQQIAETIQEILQPDGVAVVIEAVHLCMMMRGVEKQNSRTITSALRGKFRDCPMTRDEFLRLAYQRA